LVSVEPETAGFKAFAERLGCKPSYVTQLRKDGRLVLTPDGRRVLVEASLRLIADSRDPAKAGVVDRHAAARGAPVALSTARGGEGPGAADGAAAGLPGGVADLGDSESDGTADDVPPDSPYAARRAAAQMRREEALARKAERDEQVELGQLMVANDVIAQLSSAATQIRQRIEAGADILASELGQEQDESRRRAIIVDHNERILAELERLFAAIAKRGSA
jgi:hypothetical protein